VVATKYVSDEARAIDTLKNLPIGSALELKREPDNKADPKAVRVYSADGVWIGYLPAASNKDVAAALDAGATPKAELSAEAIIEADRVRFAPKITIRWGD
jgi:hypothetical protein